MTNNSIHSITLLLLIVGFVLLPGCSGDRNNDCYLIKGNKIKHAGELKLDMELLNPIKIVIKDSFFIVCDISTEKFFNIFNCKTGKTVCSAGMKGNGPDDYQNPKYFGIDAAQNKVFTYDNILKLYREYNWEDVIENKAMVPVFSKRIPIGIDDVIRLADSTYVMKGFLQRGMYAYLHKDSLEYTGIDYPGEFQLPDTKKCFLFSGNMQIKPDRTKLVFAATGSDVIDICNIKNGGIERSKLLYTYLPGYTDKSTGLTERVSISKNTPNGFNDVVCTDKYIFAVYNGRTKAKYGDDYFWGNQVYILDWNGKIIEKLILDKDIWSVCLDEPNHRLYAISPDKSNDDGGMQFFIYDLPETLEM